VFGVDGHIMYHGTRCVFHPGAQRTLKRASGDEIVHFQRHRASESNWQFKYDNEPEIWYRRMLNGDRVWKKPEEQKKSKKAHKPAKVYPGHGGAFAHAPMRYRTLPHTKGVLSESGKTEKSMWDVLRLLMEPEQRSMLIDDVMTPYMRFKLLYNTKVHIGLNGGSCIPGAGMLTRHVPPKLYSDRRLETEGEREGFELGFMVLAVIVEHLLARGKLPSVDAVLNEVKDLTKKDVAELVDKCEEVEANPPEDAKDCIDAYLMVDGRVEYLLDGLLEELEDRNFIHYERDFREWLLGKGGCVSDLPKFLKPTKKAAKELLNGVPHPLDNDLEWLRFHVRGGE
jgi:hypothetical protein